MTELGREFGRKAFHMLSLAYLLIYELGGWPRGVVWMSACLAVVVTLETARLRMPGVERMLLGFFKGMMRETERRHFSGVFHTSTGCLLAMLIAGGDGAIVRAAIFQLALGDAASALVGKAYGRTRIMGGSKSLEGAAAGLAVGFAAAASGGLPPGAALVGAVAGVLVELLPTTAWFNDNLWIPTLVAGVLRAVGAR